MKLYKNGLKRTVDVLFSGGALIFLSPIILVLIVWLHFANRGAGVFFRQERPGKKRKKFSKL